MKIPRLLLILCTATPCLLVEAIPDNTYVVENYTDNYLFVAPVRAIARTNYTKLYTSVEEGASYNKENIAIHAIPPGQRSFVTADEESGLVYFYDRALWVSSDIVPLLLSIENQRRNLLFVDALYLGRYQRGKKFIGRDKKTRKFILETSANRAAQRSGLNTALIEDLGRDIKPIAPITFGDISDMAEKKAEFKALPASIAQEKAKLKEKGQ